MGLRTNLQVLGDDHQIGFEWAQISGTAEMPKSPPQEPVMCPRCGSTKTKFCYYNNYNKSQPRHFCKSCKRHWTKGGTIRNFPGRRNKRRKIPTAAGATAEPPQQRCRNIPSTDYTTGITDQFPFSNLGYNFDQSLSDQITDCYYYPWDDNNNNNLDCSIGESTISGLDIPINYWNWNEMDVLGSSSTGLDIAWADIYEEAKP